MVLKSEGMRIDAAFAVCKLVTMMLLILFLRELELKRLNLEEETFALSL